MIESPPDCYPAMLEYAHNIFTPSKLIAVMHSKQTRMWGKSLVKMWKVRKKIPVIRR